MKSKNHSLEVLEARIAPAAVTTQLLPTDQTKYRTATLGGPVEVHAGEVLSTGGYSGGYLLYVQKGTALVYLTDLNNNKQVDYNEVTGIAGTDGLQLISFVDIHGDIVTNLKTTTVIRPGGQSLTSYSLTDSDNNAANGNDGRVLLNSTIEKIELRPLALTDVLDYNGDGAIDKTDLFSRQLPTTASIFGNIYAGKGFGTADGKNGLIIDTTNAPNFGQKVIPTIGAIKTGSAVSGEFFSFGANNGNSSGRQPLRNDQGVQLTDGNGQPLFEQDNPNFSGTMVTFTAPRGQAGGDINGLHVLTGGVLNLDGLYAGTGGVGARGGAIANIILPKDDAGGYTISAGDGGAGANGGNGGSILNFSDLGSITGEITIHTGSGGAGVSGVGGNGGDFSFGTFAPRANVHILLGSGGSGFTAGGNGASLLKGDFSQQAAVTTVDALNAIGAIRIADGSRNAVTGALNTPLQIGDNTPLDFNGDGFGDLVLTTGHGNSQLLVAFGDGTGTFYKVDANGNRVLDASGVPIENYVSLAGLRNATALLVADLNGDGHPDIAVASSDASSQQGLAVFLSRYDATGQFLGFSSPRFSVLPQLNTGRFDEFELAPQQVTSLQAGDFNGDGKVEIMAQVTAFSGSTTNQYGQVSGLSFPTQVALFLQPDYQKDDLRKDANGKSVEYATGQFYGDFGTRGFLAAGANPKSPILDINTTTEAKATVANTILRVSPVNIMTGATPHDVLFTAIRGTKDGVSTYDYAQRDSVGGFITSPVNIGVYATGKVDTDRAMLQGTDKHVSLQDALMQDFSVFDYDGDGLADLAVITPSQGGFRFLVGVHGDGTGSGTSSAGDTYTPMGQPVGQNAGYVVSKDLDLAQVKTGGFTSSFGFPALDPASTLVHAGVAVLTEKSAVIFVYHEAQDGGPVSAGFGGAAKFDGAPSYNAQSAFTLTYVNAHNANTVSPAGSSATGPSYIETAYGGFGFSRIGLQIVAGDGGDSLLGQGGRGGTVGSGKVTATLTNSTSSTGAGITVSSVLNLQLAGDLILQAGNGGDGFSKGGNGGNVSGVNLSYVGPDVGLGVRIVAGDGGRGVSSTGGAGGNVAYNCLQTSLGQINSIDSSFAITTFEAYLTAGKGGQGDRGGAGGVVAGNGTKVYDTLSELIVARAGAGGDGTHGGGAGGAIYDLHPSLPVGSVLGGSAGFGTITYTGGQGGRAIAGIGGAGGSVTNSSPFLNSFVDGVVDVEAGLGGDGQVGGAGGSLANFNLSIVSSSQLPEQVIVQAGNGGAGTVGNGGRGGFITNITLPSRGDSIDFNRIIAGDGGKSAGAAGGAGGSIANIQSSSTSGSFAIAAGAGGAGLTLGGAGGSVINASVEIGAGTLAKLLVVAGAGGDATAFVPTTTTGAAVANSFGGRVGIGGLGGSISNFKQLGAQDAHVDLIAGNGGSTIHFGTLNDTRSYVGNGGSISGIAVTGDIGNTAVDVPIKSYNDIRAGQTMQEFVQESLRTGNANLDDSLGNVGIVVGAAGKNKAVILKPDNKPEVLTPISSPYASNGVLANVSFRELLSAVAGSVDVIAAIQVVRNVTGAVVGGDKYAPAPAAPLTTGTFDYLNADNTISTKPTVGGALIDGAIVGKLFLDKDGKVRNSLLPREQRA